MGVPAGAWAFDSQEVDAQAPRSTRTTGAIAGDARGVTVTVPRCREGTRRM